MIGIGIITMLVQQTGVYWLAGAVAGTFTLANALLGPHISRLVDQHGQSRVLPVVTGFSIAMLLALITAVYLRAPAAVFFVLAALAGTMPSMPSMIRARWTQLFRGKPQLHTAFSLDTVLTEMAYIVGPPLAIGLSVSFLPRPGRWSRSGCWPSGSRRFCYNARLSRRLSLATPAMAAQPC